jgi:predicted nucleotidyltransferase
MVSPQGKETAGRVLLGLPGDSPFFDDWRGLARREGVEAEALGLAARGAARWTATDPGGSFVAASGAGRNPVCCMLSETSIGQIVALLEERFGLDALFVFGSEAAGTARRDSDVDLAALLRRRPDALELLDLRSSLEEIAARDVDLIDLGAASPILARQVLRNGRCVFGSTAPALASFEATLPSRYEDLKRVRAEAESALVQRVVHGRS